MARKPNSEELEQRVKELGHEIVKRKRAEEALRKRENYFRSLLYSIHEDILVIDSDYRTTDVNNTFMITSGLKRVDVIGRHCFEVSHGYNEPCDRRGEECMLREVFEKGEPRNCRHKHQHVDGSKIWVDILLSPLRDEKRKVAHVIEAIRDVTDLVMAEEKYRLLVENASDAIFIAQDEAVKFQNPKAEEMLGYSAEELAKIPFINLIHPEDRDRILDMHSRRLAGEELPSTYSFRMVNKTGKELWAQLNVVLVTWEGRPATLNFLRDMTTQKKLEAQLQQAQRLEGLGTLAAEITHNFNNLLVSIQGNASIVLLDIDSSHPHYKNLKNIEKQVQSGSKLTAQLLGYAREERYEVKPISLNQLVKEISDSFGMTKKEIRIHQELAEKLYGIKVDEGQIEQLLLNLYVNAADAMPGGGDLFLKTMNVTDEDMTGKPYEPKPGNYVLLTVRDTGVGMDKKTMEHIFDPLFTTKGISKGTGLGLASAYGIVKAHGGYIDVDSEKGHARPPRLSPAERDDGGQGTTFSIYLPASERKVEKPVKSAEHIIEGTGTILLVDDEEEVLDVGVQLLKILGYTALEAKGGREAVEIYQKNKDKIDMVILDMIMPGMGGGEAYDRMKEINPGIKVLLSSGYSIDGQATEIVARGCDGFIQKPFNVKELSQEVRKILDS